MSQVSKSIFKSDTMRGLVVSLVGVVLEKFDLLRFLESGNVELLVEAIFQIGGLAWAAYGRWKATAALHVV